MTEAQWLACGDPDLMLEHLRGKASDRKLRLFAVVCCRRVEAEISEKNRGMISEIEQFADGSQPRPSVNTFCHETLLCRLGSSSAFGAAYATSRDAAAIKATVIAGSWQRADPHEWRQLESEVHAEHGRFLRCIFGNPFQPITVDDSWLTPTVTGLADTIYQERAFDRLPILADALEDAGCTNADVLAHCRQPGEHVRGCWVVDLLLDKK